MNYRITASDIANGKRWIAEACAVYLAVKRQHPDSNVNVGTDFIIIGNDTFRMPHALIAFRRAFDCGRQVGPMSFSL
jgi:hypothetical protein